MFCKALLGQVCFHNLYLRQFCIGKVLTSLLHINLGGILTLLCQLLNNFQSIGIGQSIIGSRSCFGFKEYFLYVSQCFESHFVFGFHGCFNVFADFVK